ncbi:MAG: ATPase domain-containing protein [Bacteroidales bacterium]
MGYGIGKFACINPLCSSSDGMEVYINEDEDTGEEYYDATCFVCHGFFNKSKLKNSVVGEQLGIGEHYKTKFKGGKVGFEKKHRRADITPEEREDLEAKTQTKCNKFRGVRDEIHNKFCIRSEYLGEELYARHYPILLDGAITGYKKRVLPKDFTKGYVGYNGTDCEMFGQFRFKHGGKYCIIVEGEEDVGAAYQIMHDYRVSKGSDKSFEDIAVVSGTTGASGTAQQIKNNYEFFSKFQFIIVCMDNDKAGEQAIEAVCNALPSGKAKVMVCPAKDPCEVIEKGLEQKFVSAFYNAKQYFMAGVTASTSLEEKMLEHAAIERISLPNFMHRMQDMLCGGIPVGYIINILSASGTGKSTFVDAMILHWIMKSHKRVGIVSLEASEGEYAINLSSAHLGVKVNLFKTAKERLDFLNEPENVAKRKVLWEDENGNPRFYLLDSDVSMIKERVEYLVKCLGCEIIVLDPIQDIFDTMPDDAQGAFMKWQKDLVKREKVNIININHARKSGQGQKANSKGADLSEEDMMGHSSIFKSGGVNIILQRNKESEDEVERNTTYAKITKARGVGNTGPAGSFLYVNKEHKIYDKLDYLNGNPNYEVEVAKEESSNLGSGAFEIDVDVVEDEYFD